MEIKPDPIGLPGTNTSSPNTPLTALLKPDTGVLIQKALTEQAEVTDVATLLDVATSDLLKLARILEPIGVDHPPLESVDAVKLDAEVKLNQAQQVMEQTGGQKLAQWDTAPQTLLQIGRNLFDAGGYSNYVRAAGLAVAIGQGLAPQNKPNEAPPSLDQTALRGVAPSDLPKLAQLLEPAEAAPAMEHSLTEPLNMVKLDAEVKLDGAEYAIEQTGGQKLAQWQTPPQTLLQIGRTLYDAGGYSNYVRAAALAVTIQQALPPQSKVSELPMPPLDQTTLRGVAPSDVAKLVQILQPAESETGAEHAPLEPLSMVKLDAEVKLDQAQQAIEQPGGQKGSGLKMAQWATPPQTLLQIGRSLYDAGGYSNYARAGALAVTIQQSLAPQNKAAEATPIDKALLRDVAPADLAKLTQILQPTQTQLGRGEATTQTIGVAKLDASAKLNQLDQTIEQAAAQKVPHWETAPQILLEIGRKLYEAGGYANYLRAAELATALQSAYWGATVISDETAAARISRLNAANGALDRAPLSGVFQLWTAVRQRLPDQARALWRRAPLLMMLLSWLAVGLIGGAMIRSFRFEFWAVGFLAIAGFGFYATIRK